MTFEVRSVGRVESTRTSRAEAPRQGDEGAPDAWVAFDAEVGAALADLRPGTEMLLRHRAMSRLVDGDGEVAASRWLTLTSRARIVGTNQF